jgi:uncharacterized iron-regulated membrane protein
VANEAVKPLIQLLGLLFIVSVIGGNAGSAGMLLVLIFIVMLIAALKWLLLETLVETSGMGHGDTGPAVRSSALPNDRPVTLAEAVSLARGPFPHAEVRRVATPDGAAGTYRISLRQDAGINRKYPLTTVWVDRYSGHIRAVRNPSRFSEGEKLLSWLWPLHTGEALGAWGRLAWFITGLMPAFLFITGLLRWLIGRGWVRDFAVDFTSLRLVRDGLAKQASQLGTLAYRLLQSLALYAMTRILRLSEAGKHYYQELSEKREPWW